MPDDLSNRSRPDRDRINVNEDYEPEALGKEVRYFTGRAQRAVRQAGDRAEAVRQHLGK